MLESDDGIGEILGTIGSAIGSAASSAPALLPTAASLVSLVPSVMSIFGSSPADKATQQALNAMRSVTGTTTPAGKQMINRAVSGTLSPAQQAQIDQLKQNEMAQWRQYLANLGISKGSTEVQAENTVSQDALRLQNEILNQTYQQGIQALGLSTTAAGGMASAATGIQPKTDISAALGRLSGNTSVPGQDPTKSPTGQAPTVPATQVALDVNQELQNIQP